MEEAQLTAMTLLRQLLGKWSGHGTASFPTTPTFEYQEELEFVANDVQPMLRYEQRTRKRLTSGEWTPSHWEVGFIRALPEGTIELVCAKSGGRVEAARGQVEENRHGFVMDLSSTMLGNDKRVQATSRTYMLKIDQLEYTMRMSTDAISLLAVHLIAELRKA